VGLISSAHDTKRQNYLLESPDIAELYHQGKKLLISRTSSYFAPSFMFQVLIFDKNLRDFVTYVA